MFFDYRTVGVLTYEMSIIRSLVAARSGRWSGDVWI
jgi:hypothetical protein